MKNLNSSGIYRSLGLLKINALGFLLSLAFSTEAQKNIIISDSLAAKAEKLNVNMGSLWMGKIRKFSFGDYAIVSSAGMDVTTKSSNGNLFNTQTESKSTRNFSFALNNKTSDSAHVSAGAYATIRQSLSKIAVGNGWSLGRDEVVESNNLTALITVNRDSSEAWALFMGGTSLNGAGNYQAYLTNGERKILLNPVSSNKNIQNASGLNAVGYEFLEKGQSICALQYFGGFGKATSIVWMHRRLDAKMKLILASAMTVVLLVNSPLSPIY